MLTRERKATSIVEYRLVVRKIIPWKYSSSRRKTTRTVSEEQEVGDDLTRYELVSFNISWRTFGHEYVSF
jgi:hypothetical protein